MRPRGSFGLVGMALIDAARVKPGTLRELAHRSNVGYDAARDHVPKLARAGALRVVETKKVDYRNRLVHVYEVTPADSVPAVDEVKDCTEELQRFMRAWRGEPPL